MLLGGGPFLLGLGHTADVGEDRAVDHAVAVGFGQALQEFQRVTEPRLGGLDVAAEVFGGGHDAMAAGAQVGILSAAEVESRTPVTLRLAEIAEIKRDVGQADEHVYPLRGAAHERHLGLGLGAVEVASHERELRTKQADTAVLYRQEPDQLLGLGPVAQDDQHAGEAGAEFFDAHVRPQLLVQHERGVVHAGPLGL